MKIVKDEEYRDVSKPMQASSFNNIARINQRSEVCLKCYHLHVSHESVKFEGLRGLSKRGIFKLSHWGIFTFLLLLLITMLPITTAVDYEKRYVSRTMRNFTRTACEKNYLYIACPDGTTIDILHVMYGRKVPSTELCPAENMGDLEVEEDTNCEGKAGAECQGNRLCRLLVHHRVFGVVDPCPRTSKYLTVQYQCVPQIFQSTELCSNGSVRLRCRQDTVIGIYKVAPVVTEHCPAGRNSSASGCLESTIFDEVSAKCHSKRKCSYSISRKSCFNHVTITHFCVPNSFLTTEIPTYEQLQATTAPTTVPITTFIISTQGQETTTAKEDISTVQPTVTATSGDNATSILPWSDRTERISARDRTGVISTALSAIFSNTESLSNITDFTSNYQVTSPRPVAPDVENDFPMEHPPDMDNSTTCINCSASYGDMKLVNMLRIITRLHNNRHDMYIALLLGVIAVLLLTICILLYRREKRDPHKEGKDLDQITEETREDNRQSSVEHQSFQEVEEPAEEDEHENMSLLGSILQRSASSNNTVGRPHISPNASYVMANTKPPDTPDVQSDQEACGPKSIFGKICCNCCCSNPPWQRTRILKRSRGDVYHVEHRYSSSIDEDDVTAEFRSHNFPNMSRAVNSPDNPSPIPILEERVNRTEQSFVTSPAVTSSTATPPGAPLSQSQQNFRPISRGTQRHHSVTPEPDTRNRVQQTFQPQNRQPETQRSDPALNRYTVRQQHNVTQPLTAPTSPVVGHHSGNTSVANGQHLLHVFASKSPKPVMGSSMIHQSHPPPPVTPKYTPPPNLFFNSHQYPAFPNTYEHYDNAPEPSQAVRRKQFPSPRDFSSPYNHNFHGSNLSSFPTAYEDDHFVQAVQYRNIPSNARAIDLAANARTVDLSHDNTVSRNSWIEIRRSSIYDNSLPRNSDMLDYYQQFLPHDYQVPSIQQFELPGSRNLNHYYP